MQPDPYDPKYFYKSERTLFLRIGIASFVFGFLCMMFNQNIITSIYKTFVQGGVEQLLLNLPNLQFIHQYLTEHNNLPHWERVVVFFAAHILLIPFVFWLIATILWKLPVACRRAWKENAPFMPNVRPSYSTFMLIVSTFLLPVVFYLFASELVFMDKNDIAGHISNCTNHGCFFAPLMVNSLHLNSSSFLTLPIMLHISLLMLIVCICIPAFYMPLARHVYDKLHANRSGSNNS